MKAYPSDGNQFADYAEAEPVGWSLATLSMVNIRILLAAHHVSIWRGLRKFLEECPHWEIVG